VVDQAYHFVLVVGVLRFRGWFASRNLHCAQDDRSL
jgi:hypothetical protein